MTTLETPSTAAARAATLQRRVRLIVATTITYNVIEAVIAISAGVVASSAALIGFGLDSIVEVLSAGAVAWQFAGRDHEARADTAMRIIAFSFFALAAYVTFDAARSLVGGAEPQESMVGIVLAAVSVVVMPALSWFERRTGRELGSATVVADSKQTLLCAWLSGIVLGGLLLNAALGWSWADPLAALVIAVVAIKEGREALRGETCCTPASALLADGPSGCGCADGGTDACCA